tara:strand:+ start:1022 stop:1330 length:309 start_codon:yes stop_codon:yes gene_type:complete
MKTFTLEQFESYYKVKELIQRRIDYTLKRLETHQDYEKQSKIYLKKLESLQSEDISIKERILYILQIIPSIKLNIIAYSIVGNYEDIVVTVDAIVEVDQLIF